MQLPEDKFEASNIGENLISANCMLLAVLYLLSGANLEESLRLLYKWLDDLAMELDLGHSRVYDGENRVPGLFQSLTCRERAKFQREIVRKTEHWLQEAVTAGASCCYALDIGGEGARGGMFMAPVSLGPFKG